MWILPKQLHTSAYVPDTAALNLDLNESSQICAQSLFVRSKPSPARTWLQKWKRDSWSQHLFGRILNPSIGNHFVTEWTSSLGATHASPLVQPESDLEQKTQDIFGPTSQAEFGFFDPSSASSRTSKDTSVSDSEKSLENWNQSVTKRRGEYSLRVKSAHLTSASGSSSWPTANARDWKDSINGTHPPSRPNLSEQTLGQAVSVALGLPAPANPSTHGSRQGLSEEAWPTPTAMSRVRDEETMQKCLKFRQSNGKTSVPLYLEEKVNLVEKKSWATPQQRDFKDAEPLAKWTTRAEEQKAKGVNLHLPLPSQVMHTEEKEQAWATPRSRDAGDWMMNKERLAAGKPEDTLTGQATQSNKSNGKLNPRWVETLMGLPVGWTMPSCTRPVTIEQTNCDSLATELCQQQQNEHSELF